MGGLRAVVDTNVVFEGLTTRGGALGALVDAWIAQLFQPCVSLALAYEYADVLSRKLNEERWKRVRPVLDALLDRADFVEICYSWRPSSPDPGDDHIVDCAMNGRALVVTSNVRDFRLASTSLGLEVMHPVEFLGVLLKSEASSRSS